MLFLAAAYSPMSIMTRRDVALIASSSSVRPAGCSSATDTLVAAKARAGRRVLRAGRLSASIRGGFRPSFARSLGNGDRRYMPLQPAPEIALDCGQARPPAFRQSTSTVWAAGADFPQCLHPTVSSPCAGVEPPGWRCSVARYRKRSSRQVGVAARRREAAAGASPPVLSVLAQGRYWPAIGSSSSAAMPARLRRSVDQGRAVKDLSLRQGSIGAPHGAQHQAEHGAARWAAPSGGGPRRARDEPRSPAMTWPRRRRQGPAGSRTPRRR